ncbi:MAG: radical SAM family heme chaperone HemW [Spirochaetaceae bacterium]|nr:radical SAM family heme chaperone HemW [Spirochaetaceae bacterium]
MTSFDTIPSLYIHIPYCGSKCSYCDFFSLPSAGVPDQYVDALVAQLRSFRDAGFLVRLKTVYFGGGTPSLLSCAQLSRIMEEVCPHLEPDAEVTLEANPESLTRQLLAAARGCGIGRISLGIQSFDDGVLGCVGRCCTAGKARRALGLLAESGMAFCTDFIAGLPEQGDQEFLAGLEEVVAYRPRHVSLYSLTVEEGTRLHRQIESGQLDWFPEMADSQWIAGRDLLEAAGYLQYEVSNFAPAGQESRHNCAYWRQQSYLGAGAGAAGTLYRWGASGELLGGLRYTNTTNIDEYVGFWSAAGGGQGVFSGSGTDSGGEAFSGHTLLEAMPAQREELDRDTLAFEHLMLALRMKEGVDCGEYRRRFGRELAAAATGGQEADGRRAASFKDFCRRGWMQERRQGGAVAGYTMTGEGLLFLNLILERLLEC